MVLELCCYILAAQMWNLLAGYAGLVSVGQQAFMGAAGYALFVMAQTFGINPFLAIGLSLLAPAVLAVPCYMLLHRLDGPYFAIGTWVVAEVFRLVASNLGWVKARGRHVPERDARLLRFRAQHRHVASLRADDPRRHRRRLLVPALALRPCADRHAGQPGGGGEPGR